MIVVKDTFNMESGQVTHFDSSNGIVHISTSAFPGSTLDVQLTSFCANPEYFPKRGDKVLVGFRDGSDKPVFARFIETR